MVIIFSGKIVRFCVWKPFPSPGKFYLRLKILFRYFEKIEFIPVWFCQLKNTNPQKVNKSGTKNEGVFIFYSFKNDKVWQLYWSQLNNFSTDGLSMSIRTRTKNAIKSPRLSILCWWWVIKHLVMIKSESLIIVRTAENGDEGGGGEGEMREKQW